MTFWKTENSIESKNIFYEEIKQYYTNISDNKIPTELLTEIIEKVTNKIYTNYCCFWDQYPKSRKRYSKLKLADLQTDFIYFLITDFLKDKNEYRNFSKVLLTMNDKEFDEYENRKHWYETK